MTETIQSYFAGSKLVKSAHSGAHNPPSEFCQLKMEVISSFERALTLIDDTSVKPSKSMSLEYLRAFCSPMNETMNADVKTANSSTHVTTSWTIAQTMM